MGDCRYESHRIVSLTSLSELAKNLERAQNELFKLPIGVDSEWVRRVAGLLIDARGFVTNLIKEETPTMKDRKGNARDPERQTGRTKVQR